MTDEELYFFDTFGYLKVEKVIDEVTTKKAFEASERIVNDYQSLYQDAVYGDKYGNAMLYDKTLEKIASCSNMLDYVCPLLNNMPRLLGGTMMINGAQHADHKFHCQKEIDRYRVENAPGFFASYGTRSIFCDLFTAFLYLTDVRPGDGGLVVIPGSHKSEFYYPKENPFPLDMEGAVTVTVNAGDMIIMPLRLVHAAHKWVPKDRDRRVMMYSYAPQDIYSETLEGELEKARNQGIDLEEDTLEFMAFKQKGLHLNMKEVIKQHVGELAEA